MLKYYLKCLVVGDRDVGKTSLLERYTYDTFVPNYNIACFVEYDSNVIIDGISVNLAMWETIEQDEYDQLRLFHYPQTDVFLICFSLANVNSFERVQSKWYPEVRHHCPDVPLIIVGTKKDLRDAVDGPVQSVDSAQGIPRIYKEMAKPIVDAFYNVYKYAECSAKTGDGVRNVFEEAIRAVLNRAQKEVKKQTVCNLF